MINVGSPSPLLTEKPALFTHYQNAWQTLAPHTRRKTMHKDEAILHHGDSANNLWLVLKGWVKLTRQTPDGKETIIGLCTDGDIFGEAALFPHGGYPYNAQTISTDTELALIPSEIIRSTVSKDAAFSNFIMSLLNERVAQSRLKLEHMNTLSAAQRIGCFLLRLCNKSSSNKQSLQIPVEKHLLASYLGMKPETFSRSLQQLKPLEIHIDGFQVNIGNVEKLRHFVCESCSESGSCETEL